MNVLLAALLVAGSLPILCVTSYLFVLVLLSGRPRAPVAGNTRRFCIVVPAHDEEMGIARTVENLRALHYPRDAFSVLVVADNCSDATADRARAAGAVVLERHDEGQRGKGYALLFAFAQLEPTVDAVVVIDADTLVSPNLLGAFAARLQAGAGAVQADYAVQNPHQAWRTRLSAIAFGCFHIVRGRGRERLGLSAGLRGNGMCFSRELLGRVPHDAFSIVEDVEYGIRLGEAGVRVHYADEAHVYGEMVSTAAAAGSQRKRWEGGRKALARAHGLRLVKKGLAARDRVLFDLGFDLLVPPLSRIVVAAGGALVLAAVGSLAFGGALHAALAVCSLSPAIIALYVLRGWSVSNTGLRGLRDLALAPIYVIWKMTLGGGPARADGPWVRTTREAQTRSSR